MVNTRMMYLRPGNLFKDFVIETSTQTITRTGRPAVGHSGDGSRMFRGCLAEASDEERKAHSLPEHIVTHTIVQSGPPMAKRTDKLVLGNRVFYIVDVDDTGMLGLSTLYYAEERRDLK
ncbi:hypothetical protein [Candidatus Merdisoma sp. JLR.KK006]|uniref:hypothetical protein n=1 Tax=Candidatus Merdisoma sp. JLR.KK006 TaxID=3112626 RepID=UPI002FF19D11